MFSGSSMKRLMDILVSFLGLLFLSPVLAVVQDGKGVGPSQLLNILGNNLVSWADIRLIMAFVRPELKN